MNDQVTQMAAGVGLEYHLDRARPGNTFDAHRLIHLGRAHGIADAVKERLLRAYFTEGELLSDHETLVRLGAEAGLDADEARDALASDRFAAAVREELVEAHDLGLQGVPAFVFDRRSQVTGAQPADLFLQALERAWATSAA
jgi:predicted DsbA family dithiol-disulfide isomerase